MVLKYKFGWLWWCEWVLLKFGVFVILVKFLYIVLFIFELVKCFFENNIGVFFIEFVVYVIKWGYVMVGIEVCFVSYFLVKFVLEGVKRRFV